MGKSKLNNFRYIISYKKEYGSWKSEEIFGDLNTYTIGNLQCGMRYDFYITAIDGNGEKSEIITGRTSGRAPIAPEKEDLLTVNDTSVTIQLNSWKSGGCPITHFEIKYKQQRQKNWILFADRVSSNRKSITISSLSPSTWYQLQLTSHNEAGPTEAEYIFTTGAAVKGALPDAVLVSGEAVPFYLELEVVLPVSLSLVVVVAVLVLVCLIVRKRNPTETSQTAASATYVSRKSQAGESVHMCEMEKSTYQRPVSRAHDPIYYPTPYATTHIADGPCRKSLEAVEREKEVVLDKELWRLGQDARCVFGCYGRIGLGGERDFGGLPMRRDEERVLDPPWCFKMDFFEDTGEKSPALDRENLRGEPWLEQTGREPWMERT
ncbi:down syndrome cell adhesion molecule-like protein Dscam2 [Trichonephila clavipes]|nr:down syndrome cell adhesion molecule-like protein Dscam2 [Trichonephila clavipes]